MNFEKINNPATYHDSFVKYQDRFISFTKDFDIVGVGWEYADNKSASYMLRLLLEGNKARPRGLGKKVKNDEMSSDLRKYYMHLLDHGAFWKMSNGRVFFTGMPYADEKLTTDTFLEMVRKYQYPENIKLRFLDEKYKYRPNGTLMAMIYDSNLDAYFPVNRMSLCEQGKSM